MIKLRCHYVTCKFWNQKIIEDIKHFVEVVLVDIGENQFVLGAHLLVCTQNDNEEPEKCFRKFVEKICDLKTYLSYVTPILAL
jgi:hypothetical protein